MKDREAMLAEILAISLAAIAPIAAGAQPIFDGGSAQVNGEPSAAIGDDVYFGDLHIHTMFSSDAVGDPAELYQVARYELGLDFVAITDHDTTMDASEWDATRALASATNVPGVFIAFSGIEWTYGHHFAVYFLRDDEPFCTTCNTVQRFYDFYGEALRTHRAGTHFAHPVTCCIGGITNLDDSLVPNVEIWNGRSEMYDQEYGPYGALWLLGQGYRLGFVGVSDDHSFDGTGEHPRRLGNTLTGCHAASLTRASILEALRNRRCFATDNLRTVVDMDVEGTPMGGETEACAGEPFDVQLFVSGTTTPARVEIVQDGVVVAARSDCSSPDCNLGANLLVSDTVNYTDVYGRVRHDPSTGCVNCVTWSSPVRVARSTDPECLPEPSSTAMVLSGAGALLGLSRARRRRPPRGEHRARARSRVAPSH